MDHMSSDYIFDINYTNHAWGYTNNGNLIMSDGSIRYYDLSRDSPMTLDNKIQNSKNVGVLSRKSILDLSRLANDVKHQSMKDMKLNAFDAGTTEFSMYDRHDMRKITLGYGGDHMKLNLSAVGLIIYLAELTDTKYFPGYDVIKNLIRDRHNNGVQPMNSSLNEYYKITY